MAQLHELADDAGGERFVRAGDDQFSVQDVLEEELGGDFFLLHGLLELHILNVVEELEDVLVIWVADDPQQGGCQKLPAAAAAVEINIQEVVRVELHLKPCAAVGDDAETIEPASIQVLGALKADARRAVKLADDDTLGAIDDERSTISHERNFPHVNALLLGTGLVAQLKCHIERRTVRFRLANRLKCGELRLADFVHDEIERHFLVIALDGEHLLEDRLQAKFLALGREDALLEKLLIRAYLNFDEIRRLGDFVDFAKIDALGHDEEWCYGVAMAGRRRRGGAGIKNRNSWQPAGRPVSLT